jgi:hypothetical protein
MILCKGGEPRETGFHYWSAVGRLNYLTASTQPDLMGHSSLCMVQLRCETSALTSNQHPLSQATTAFFHLLSPNFVVSHLPVIGFISTVGFSNSWCQEATSLIFRRSRSSVYVAVCWVAFVVARKSWKAPARTYTRTYVTL